MTTVVNPAAPISPSNYGSYTGNDTANRAIPHGLTDTPSIVFIYTDSTYWYRIMRGLAKVLYAAAGAHGSDTVTAMDDTNFYVGKVGDYPTTANSNGVTYYWVAIL